MDRIQERIGSYLANHARRNALCLLIIFALLFGASLYCAIYDVIHDYNPVYTGITFLDAIGCFISFVVTLALLHRFTEKMGVVLSWIGVALGGIAAFCLLIVSHENIYLLFYLPGSIMAAIILFEIVPGLVVSGIVLVLTVLYLYIPAFNGNNPMLDAAFQVTFMIVLVAAVIISLISVIGRQLIENTFRQYALKYRELAYRDTLTNLYNHSYYDHCARLFHEKYKAGETLGVLFMDLDGLKRINDQYGHPIGNDALIAISRAMEKCEPTLLIRYAGDEFIILEPKKSKEELLEEAERVIQAVENTRLESVPELRLTISVGLYVGEVKADSTLDEFIMAADKQLYVSKQNGKNRVSAA